MINGVKYKGQIKHYQDMNDMDYVKLDVIQIYRNIE